MLPGDIICWEAVDPADASLAQVRRLYETALDPAERIPWEWIEEGVTARHDWRPGRWSPHLLMAAARRAGRGVGPVIGFAYGAHVPGYGGYACYLAVEERARRRGAGTRLLQVLTRCLQTDAACEGIGLPFVVWESHAPEDKAASEERARWHSRLRLFERAGARWISGLTFFAPNFHDRRAPPVPLHLFLIPVDAAVERFDAAALRDVAAGLLRGVYRRREGDPLFVRTLPADCEPSLRPVADLLRTGQ